MQRHEVKLQTEAGTVILMPKTIANVHLLLSTGKMTSAEIAKFAGVGESTVRRESKKLSLNISAA